MGIIRSVGFRHSWFQVLKYIHYQSGHSLSESLYLRCSFLSFDFILRVYLTGSIRPQSLYLATPDQVSFSPAISATAPGSMLTGLPWGVHWSTGRWEPGVISMGPSEQSCECSCTSPLCAFYACTETMCLCDSYTRHVAGELHCLENSWTRAGPHGWFIQVAQ